MYYSLGMNNITCYVYIIFCLSNNSSLTFWYSFSYYECFCEHWCTNICMRPCFQIFGYLSRSGIVESYNNFMFSSVQFSRSVMSNSLQPHGPQHARPPCLAPTPRVYSNSCPLSWWCHPTISSSVVPFSSCPQSFPASGSFPMSQFFTSGSQSIGASASASVLSMNIQGWFPLGRTGWISLLSKGLSGVFSNTTVQNFQVGGIKMRLPGLGDKKFSK